MKTTHTPGPWFFDKYDDGTPLFCDGRGRDVLTANNAVGDDERARNVALIVAAPDLLDALRGLVNCHTGACWQTPEAQRRWWLAADAAIAKAECRRQATRVDNAAAFMAMAEAILDDDNGVSERAYTALLQFAETVSSRCADELRSRVDATDGRFYLPSEARS